MTFLRTIEWRLGTGHEIVRHGTGKTFSLEDNRRWSEVTRPIVEALFHPRFFLQMAVRYAHELFRSPGSTWILFRTRYRASSPRSQGL